MRGRVPGEPMTTYPPSRPWPPRGPGCSPGKSPAAQQGCARRKRRRAGHANGSHSCERDVRVSIRY